MGMGRGRARTRIAGVVTATAIASLGATTQAEAATCSLFNIGACLAPQKPAGTGGGTTTTRTTSTCSLLNLRACLVPAPTSPPPPNALPLAPGGNPYNITPLPPIQAGQPLYPYVRGHLPYALADTAAITFSSAETGAAAAAGIGASHGRVVIEWPDHEPKRGQFEWTNLDAVYRRYIREGVRPALQIVKSPQWAVSGIDALLTCSDNECASEPTKDRLPDLRRFARALASRYPLLGAVEYGNEPNHGTMPRQPERYARSLSSVFKGVHDASAGIPVWGGALSTSPGWADYLRRIFAADGLMDAISIHPYETKSDYYEMRGVFSGIDGIVAGTEHAGLRIVISETGAPVRPASGSGDAWFSDGPMDGFISQYERLRQVYDDLDARSAQYEPLDPPLPGVDRVDLVVFYSTFTHKTSPDFGWMTARTSGAPRDVWCRWRTQVAGLPRFNGSELFAACPS